MPRHHEAPQRVGVDGLDLVPQLRERAAAQAAEHVGLDPLALGAAGPELALDEPSGLGEPLQQRPDHRDAEPVAGSQLRRRERAVRAGKAHRQIAGRVAHRLEQRFGQPGRHGHAERVAVARHVLDRDVARLAGDRQWHHPPRPHELGHRVAGACQMPTRSTISSSVRSPMRISEVVDAVGAAHLVAVFEVLQAPLELGECVRVEEIAQFGVAEQLAQLRLIDRQRLRPPLRQRRVAVVDVVGDVAEEQ